MKSEKDERKILGNTLVTEATFPFKTLGTFGNAFLSKLLGATCTSPLLDHLILVDTPGILSGMFKCRKPSECTLAHVFSGEKQRISRGYDFEAVVKFMANKVDRILLLFDVSKLDISDEFNGVIGSLKGNEEKVTHSLSSIGILKDCMIDFR
ncbi:MAG: hypothetical protein GY696_07570 [Gammaproteobacteria bacterium]|nr:hypothetical protein [Gammaproteobacteria bacterium]